MVRQHSWQHSKIINHRLFYNHLHNCAMATGPKVGSVVSVLYGTPVRLSVRCAPRPSSLTTELLSQVDLAIERRATAGASRSLIDLTIPSPVRAYVSIHDSVRALYVDWKAFSVSGQRACLGHYWTACRFLASYSLDLLSN